MAFFAARQPILDIDKNVYAYELLFRDSLANAFPNIGEDQATSKMLDGLHLNLGLETLTNNKLAFINFSEDTLFKRYPHLLPNHQVVVEILETVKPGKRLLKVVKNLKDNGYMVALDDYIHEPVWRHFFPYIDIIKIDWRAMSIQEIKQVIQDIRGFPKIKLLAEKVETHEDYETAKSLGFTYFQGYFFSRPEVMQRRSLQPSHLALGQLMTEMANPDPNINMITRAFESDVNLSFKLLRYTQSPIFKRRNEISNIKQAILVLGHQELRRFVSLLFTAQFSSDKPAELTTMSLVRARFCETVAQLPGQSASFSSAFLVGLLSLLDAMLDTELHVLLEKLPLSESIKAPFIDGNCDTGRYLQLVRYFETANWDNANALCEHQRIKFEDAFDSYNEAVKWATERSILPE